MLAALLPRRREELGSDLDFMTDFIDAGLLPFNVALCFHVARHVHDGLGLNQQIADVCAVPTGSK